MASRVAKAPVIIPNGVEVVFEQKSVSVKGPKGMLSMIIVKNIELKAESENDARIIRVSAKSSDKQTNAMSGTTRALLNNMVTGVSQGFEKTLELVGVGYRAQVKDQVLNLSLGFSHPIDFNLPEGVQAETPNNTTVILRSINKQLLGQTAAEIRSYRKPEPYKGKGVKYANEIIKRKETKKK
jgi:large subunit ribosomal protein L6